MMEYGDFFGMVGAVFGSITFIPQALQVFKTKRTRDLSLQMLLFCLFGNIAWFVHGVCVLNMPILFASTMILTVTVPMLLMKIHNDILHKPLLLDEIVLDEMVDEGSDFI